MAEIRINATGGVKLYDADDSHYCQIVAGTISANVDILTLNSAGITVADGAIDFDIASHDTSNGLKLGGTLVTATAAELNIMDGVGATASEINLIDGSAKSTSSITIADADAFIVIDGTTTKQIPASDITTYVGGVSLSGSTNNTVASVTGANALIGEAKLLFDPPKLTIGNATAEDTLIVFDGNAQDFHIGLDDSTDSLTIGLGSTLGTTSHIVIDEAGHVTMPLQSCFQVQHNATSQDDVGNNTTFNMDNEIFDLKSDFNTSNYTFTAPVTGKYLLTMKILYSDMDSSASLMEFDIATSNRAYRWGFDPRVYDQDSTGGEMCSYQGSVIADMDASDTSTLIYYQTAGDDQVNLLDLTTFCGVLVA